ncbi:hypothetical protein QTP88_005850 [Uroleucon formosanum]
MRIRINHANPEKRQTAVSHKYHSHYPRGPQQYRDIGLIGSGIGNSRLPQMPNLALIVATAAVALPRKNYNCGHHPYQNSAPRSGLHRGNDYYRGLGSVNAIEKNQQRKIVIDGPDEHVSQPFIR